MYNKFMIPRIYEYIQDISGKLKIILISSEKWITICPSDNFYQKDIQGGNEYGIRYW